MVTLSVFCAWASEAQVDDLHDRGVISDDHLEQLDERGYFHLPGLGKYNKVSVAVDGEKAPESLEEVVEHAHVTLDGGDE